MYKNPTDHKSSNLSIKTIFDPGNEAFPYVKALLDAIPNGVLVTDDKGNICYANINYYSRKKQKHNSDGDFIGMKVDDLTDIPLCHDVLKDGKARYGYVKCPENAESYYCDVVPIMLGTNIAGTFGYGWEHIIKLLKEKNSMLTRANNKLSNQVNSAYRARHTIDDFKGNCENIRKVKQLALKMARTDADILIIGESGTGKEIISQAIHNASRRSHERFVAINCATLSRELITSELFGYTDGAFTGAKKGGQVGLFEVADNGTVLLDEISELDGDLQAKLLRVLEERRVRRVGSTEEKAINVRVIALSNKNLKQMVRQGTFRADLYYRLNVLSIEIPALRERRDDIIILAEGMLAHFSHRLQKNLMFSESAKMRLRNFPWPGNVRELRNAVDYAANMCDGNVIEVSDLPQWMDTAAIPSDEPDTELSLETQLNLTERKAIEAMLNKYGRSADSKKIIAEKLGISLSNLYNKMKNLGIQAK